MIILVATLSGAPARAGILWYNGDADNLGSLINETNVPINYGSGFTTQNALVYDNFIVPAGETWTISSVYSNNAMAYAVAATTATWQIRIGVSSGNGGTPVAGGGSSATQVANGTNGSLTEYTVTASIGSVVLNAGEYWLAVAPDSKGNFGDQSYVDTTSGANAVGAQPSDAGTSYISYTYPTVTNYESAATFLGNTGPNNFSMGIVGTFVAVPEPSSKIQSAIGLAGLSLSQYRRTRDQPT